MCCWNWRMSKFRDLTGQVFGHLTVLGVWSRNRSGQPLRRCRCVCGKEIEVVLKSLTRGETKSCGCSNNCAATQFVPTHGQSRKINGKPTPTYGSWCCMRSRCKPNSDKSHLYFERGISICERWNKFENFLEDMGFRPSSDHTLDRIDVNGNYCPENCRWATSKEQGQNRRSPTGLEIEIRALRKKLAAYELKFGLIDADN